MIKCFVRTDLFPILSIRPRKSPRPRAEQDFRPSDWPTWSLDPYSNKSKYIFQTRKEPFFLGIAVFLYGITFSLNTGYAINPARDLGPRLFIQLVGFPRAFTRGNDTFDNYWWIPLLGPAL